MTTETGSTGIHCERCGRRTEVMADLVSALNRAETALAVIEGLAEHRDLEIDSVDDPDAFNVNAGVCDAMHGVRAVLKGMKWSWEKKT